MRVFPLIAEVLAGNNNGVTWERLPNVARVMNFNLSVRDNNTNWGRQNTATTTVTVANTGPFAVLTPNGGESYPGASSQTVTWSVNGTSSHCPNVDVLVSTDNGDELRGRGHGSRQHWNGHRDDALHDEQHRAGPRAV